MARKRILVVEDIPTMSIAYAASLEKAGYEAVVADSGAAAVAALEADPTLAAMILDLQLPDVDGLTLLREQAGLTARLPVIVITADGSLSRAIEAMRLGAFDFMVKPVAGSRLVSVVESALQLGAGPARAAPPPQRPVAGGFIGSSAPMQAIYAQVEKVARSRATVFITGESGTGKEVCAETIHRQSGRGGGPFVAINCGAIPENLLESELFGHLKGAFTGAVSDRIGAVQAANRGTLFLDEIGEMPLALQVKLLRFLQTGTVQRVGASRTEEVDVRIICATNRDPQREVAEGRFREDFYYRLAVVPIHMPPLRDRQGDLVELAQSFLQRFAREEDKTFAPLGPAQVRAIEAYHWPGNVRELQNVMRRATVLNDGPELPISAFPLAVEGAGMAQAPGGQPAEPLPPPPVASSAVPRDTLMLIGAIEGLTLDEIERIAIEAAIDRAGGSLPAAARALGVSPSTLYRKRERWTMGAAAGVDAA